MKLLNLVLTLGLCLTSSSSWAQNIMCPTRTPGDSTNACASTAFVTTGIAADFASPPPLGNIVPNQVFSTTLSATGLTTLDAQIAYNPVTNSAAGVVPGLFEQYTATGSLGAATSGVVNAINIPTDSLAMNDPASLVIQSINDFNFGGSLAKGGREMLLASLTQTTATEATHTFRAYVGAQGAINSTSGDGGGSGTEKGDYYGLWGTATIGPSATFVKTLQSLELDINAPAGSSLLYKSGLVFAHVNLAGNGPDAVHGSLVDTNFWVFNATGNIGANTGILFGRADGFGGLGVASTGSLLALAAETATLGNGIDLTGGGAITISGCAFKSFQYCVDGLGNITANSFSTGGNVNSLSTSTVSEIINAPTGGNEGAGTINISGAYYDNGTVGATCTTAPTTASFSAKGGLVTHC